MILSEICLQDLPLASIASFITLEKVRQRGTSEYLEYRAEDPANFPLGPFSHKKINPDPTIIKF